MGNEWVLRFVALQAILELSVIPPLKLYLHITHSTSLFLPTNMFLPNVVNCKLFSKMNNSYYHLEMRRQDYCNVSLLTSKLQLSNINIIMGLYTLRNFWNNW